MHLHPDLREGDNLRVLACSLHARSKFSSKIADMKVAGIKNRDNDNLLESFGYDKV
ncbi:hypothetical protein SAMN05216417_11055 [Nitrosospira multiformis]|jgi:hypothetical protein|uniref:Uncharacterized protein n=1 Tax=Nitrosospira multiformis TaxID=1231 RepID=A0A1I7HLI4_9PROT|nr:hypothetical protein SAMN05216417_11055 [Nitrosospira multiformis]